MTVNALAILGAGRHGRVVAECAEAVGWRRVQFFFHGSSPEQTPDPWPLVGGQLDLIDRRADYDGVIVVLGDNADRLRVHRELIAEGLSPATLIHPRACLSPRATTGAGSVILAGASVVLGACLGEAVIVNTGATVDHDCELGDGVHISPGANLAGGVRVGDRAWIGVGAVVRQNLSIGRDAVVGAGSVVVRDVPDGMTVVGNPARPLER